MNLNIGFVSLGCDKNRIDSEIMLSKLSKEGYKIVNDEKEADIIIINTCGFINSAKEESINTILEMAENKKTGRCKLIIVAGCMAERYKGELLEEMPEIDAVVGTGNYYDICNIVKEALSGKYGIVKTDNLNYNFNYEERILTTPKHYAYIKIAEGCDNQCSYCIIPKLRGKFRSRDMDSIIHEAKELSKKGVKEIILVAQDTTMYGVDIYGKRMLPQLLKNLEAIEEIQWIRVMYSYPEKISDELIETIAKSNKICHYFDIPIQHISNNILKQMKRASSSEEIITKINNIRNKVPDAVIRTSLIVGFPGETEEDFNKLKQFLMDYKLDRVGVFTYSIEKDTIAAKMKDQIDDDIKNKRKDILMKLQSEISFNKNKEQIGKIIDVIIDGKTKNNQYYGRTYKDAPEIDQQVFINCNDNKIDIGTIIKVKIIKAYTYDLIGVVYDESCK
ncbi:SSU ribosomal protein S12P methylthiotransferase [Caloramator quimbayensis]|uniref:Ribosomal protein uS12 methylthiotransferase RimO n=1 Tax=Caloramator quimbayensis TaxID=1147123 RepID=A0A1T4XB08_9CLOT|nr:30S ribosomal protein S12 methylthiotransferase RimO [Caloramator quimbayensis]SKA86780.1 SSU ribosomal protein S12P methylthiotransferase [Caloramator quimbayensis]